MEDVQNKTLCSTFAQSVSSVVVQERTSTVFVCHSTASLYSIFNWTTHNHPSVSVPFLTKLMHTRASLNATTVHLASASAGQCHLRSSQGWTHGARRHVVIVGCGKDKKFSSCIHTSFSWISTNTPTIPINQPTRCNSFTRLLLDVYVWCNMFRAPPRPSSGAYNCTSSLWFYRWRVTVIVLLVVVWQVPDHDQQRSSRFSPTVKPEAPSAVVCSWWWAKRRPKHGEPHINVK